MSTERGRLLVTEDEPSYGVLAGVRALRAAGWEAWLALTGPGTYSGRSRAVAGRIAVPDPALDAAAYVDAIAAACTELGPAAVLPGTENGLVALAGARLPDGVANGAPAAELVDRVTDKAAVEAAAAAAGLGVPETTRLTRAGLDEAAPTLAYPAVVKSVRTKVRGEGGLRHGSVRRVDSTAELLAAAADLPGDELLVQPFLPGRLEAVSGVAWEGRLVTAVHQAAHRICPPDCGLSAFAETVPRDGELEAAIGRLIGELGWSGLFQAQFMRDGARAALIDFNPRMYGSLALAVSAGANLPALWVELLLGREPQPMAQYRVGARYRAEEKDARVLAAELRRGRLGAALAALRPRRDVTHAAFSLRDPLPLLTSLAKARRLRR